MTAREGDYIIIGVQGEMYPCKADIFKATYDKVGSTGETTSGGSENHFEGKGKDTMLRFFEYKQLPEKLQKISEPFFKLAMEIVNSTPSSAERTAGLRKLLEAKDCTVRANL